MSDVQTEEQPSTLLAAIEAALTKGLPSDPVTLSYTLDPTTGNVSLTGKDVGSDGVSPGADFSISVSGDELAAEMGADKAAPGGEADMPPGGKS